MKRIFILIILMSTQSNAMTQNQEQILKAHIQNVVAHSQNVIDVIELELAIRMRIENIGVAKGLLEPVSQFSKLHHISQANEYVGLFDRAKKTAIAKNE